MMFSRPRSLLSCCGVRRIYLLAGVFRRRSCGRVARGDGSWQTGETSLLRRAVALDSLRSYYHLIAFRRQKPLL